MTAAAVRLRTGWLATSRAHASHARLGRSSFLILGQSQRGPTDASIAGSSVSTTETEITGISAPPIPVLRRNGTGRTTSESRPTATVSPETKTDRPAVSIAARTASSFSRPWARSSRHLVTNSNE